MQGLRAAPWDDLGGQKIEHRIDLWTMTETSSKGRTLKPSLPKADVLVWRTEGGTRLIVRPSGTEPKIKFYLEAQGPKEAMGDLQERRAQVDQLLKDLRQEITSRIG